MELTWPTGAIKNAWLEVQVLANPDTGLADLGGLYAGLGDVFYFANVVGDVRETPILVLTSSTAPILS